MSHSESPPQEGCGLCPDLRSSRICSGWEQDTGSRERPPPSPSSLHRGLPSGRTCHLWAHPWEPSNPLVNPSKDRQQEFKGLSDLYGWSLLAFHPMWREKVSGSKHEGKFCFASLVLSQTWWELHLCGLSCLFEEVILPYLTTVLFKNCLKKELILMSNKYVITVSKDFSLGSVPFLIGAFYNLYVFNLICII